MITGEYDYTDQEVYEMTCECPAYYSYNGGGQTLYCWNIWNIAKGIKYCYFPSLLRCLTVWKNAFNRKKSLFIN